MSTPFWEARTVTLPASGTQFAGYYHHAVAHGGTEAAADARAAEVRDMYARLLQGDLSGNDALAASQQMLQILMDSMANAVFWKDRQSRYLGCNKVFASFAGVEPRFLLGMTDRDMPWADSAEFSADWFIDWDQKVMSSGEPQFGIVEQLRNTAGECRWLQTNKVPLRDLDGRIIGVLGTFEDITDRRRTEDELQRTLDELDERVQHRTAELVTVNESLRREVEDRVRLQAQERQQRGYAEALRDTAAAISGTRTLDGVLHEVLIGVQRLVTSDLAAVVLVEPGGMRLSNHRTGFSYDTPHLARAVANPSTLSIIRRLAIDEGPIIINEPIDSIGVASSTLGARISVADQMLGYLLVESGVHGFYNASHADRLGAIADQAGAAISNARLAGRASELAAAEERQRLAHELHDAVNQTLWTAAITAESLLREVDTSSPLHHHVSRLHRLTRGALSEMRALLLELRPSDLIEVSLSDLIGFLLMALECRRTLEVDVSVDDVELTPDAHLVFYRITQETLRNITQHAGASAVSVQLTAGPDVTLTIVDDGHGFDPTNVPKGHLGLAIMQERAASIGARLDITSVRGTGTTVRLSYPRPRSAP